MHILILNGSTRDGSSNQKLLDYLPILAPEHTFEQCQYLQKLPLFYPDFAQNTRPKIVQDFQATVAAADAIWISTPAYLNNMPAVLKNALEWLTTSGELDGKRVLAMTYTPHPPRGEKVLQSLLWTLTALKAQTVVSIELYHTDIAFDEKGKLIKAEGLEMLEAACTLLLEES